MASSKQLPSHYRALQLDTLENGFELKSLPVPSPVHGSAIVKVEQAWVFSYHRDIYNGERHYDFPKPIVGGSGCIGRIAETGPDATLLHPGQLVYVDSVIHGRDNPDDLFLSAIHSGSTEGSQKLCRDVWRNGAFGELCHELGYTTQQLAYLGYLLVPFGGLRDIRLEPGETIVISPATGGFGGAGVQVAIAMGARVIAMGRNERELARLKQHINKGTPTARIDIVKITGDEKVDTASLRAFGPTDAVLDLTPLFAENSTHLKCALSNLRRNGRAILMGLAGPSFPMDPWSFIGRNIALKGKLMYEREDILQFVKMLEAGLFPRGEEFVNAKTFDMEDWKMAFDVAAEHTGIGKVVSIKP
ncbi:quinone oxidoreductase, putative [Talaromyces stipitatus ATCC 10500]|uniref:Quinone oxidoreductase, putative n=1 Tax=Talaromyces stipitatus (strain ATCC 10500 / CBS 375.48 / QM 6759 / NRRL 1006) TaxID=441959 RepID=B8MSP4_TALSN|nr:quinone oxidoreductase, putative [Talaromyces stipitatus ATCC 10500]EED12502.1 quinone oxidoreductase, putative [Talaromyces stipitatus ATCC 10500]